MKKPSHYPEKEEDLSFPVVHWLEGQGYRVNQEVKNCDITAVKEKELILLELKLRFSLTLVYQALERKDISPSVYIVIPLKGGRSAPPQYSRMKKLLQSLQIGLIVVRYMSRKIRVEALLHPREYPQRKRHRRKAAILREIDSRYGEFNRGGQPSGARQMTAYRQEALHLAWLLSRLGDTSPAELRRSGASVRSQSILSMNHYGWFEKVSRGIYRLHAAGMNALEEYQDVVGSLSESWEAKRSSQS